MKTRHNHYVPEWYQKGFIVKPFETLHYLNLNPDKIYLPNGTIKAHNNCHKSTPGQCFYKTDLYTTFFGPFINDEIERKLFGKISGAR